MSDTKAKPLMWRRFAEEFVGKNQYTAAQAFQVKQIYYKSLVAFEISNHWKREPPPKEILEDVSAKGANVMTRTMENFVKPQSREEVKLQENGSATSDQQTPKEEKAEFLEDPGSAAGRTTRGLRQQPPQRVLFQPDLAPGRQTRGPTGTSHHSPTPGAMTNGLGSAFPMTNGASSTLANYEPSQSFPLSLKPVVTPANNPEHYHNERKRKLEAEASPLARRYKNVMLPGTGFIGPNIYVRAQLALQSGIPDEESYALHHLVKISHERGDKYRFDQFPGLAESLARKVLHASSMFYDVEWDINYDDDSFASDDETLNGLYGTSNIIEKLMARPMLVKHDDIVDNEFQSHMNRITEAGLVFRNMCMMEDNARYVAALPLTRDMIALAINLPNHWTVTELRQYALEIAEQVLKFCDVSTQEDLYKSLLSQLRSYDRGTIMLSLRTISRIAMALPPPKKLDNVSPELLRRVQDWLLVEDEELRAACLDFLMQYTSFADNVESLLQAVDSEALARQLSRLLLFDAKEYRHQRAPPEPASESGIAPVPRLSRSLVETLIRLDEPQRSSEWLRMCFLPDPESEMTQISLWQAYQGTFSPFASTHPHLIAGEFIKNVSTVFKSAFAQVVLDRYVIQGIRSRKVPVESAVISAMRPCDKGKDMIKCCWRVEHRVNGIRDPTTGLVSAPTTRIGDCGEWFLASDEMLKHILASHLGLPAKQAAANGDHMDVDSRPAPMDGLAPSSTSSTLIGPFDIKAADREVYRCRWSDCQRTSADYSAEKGSQTALLARHIQTHLPDPSAKVNKHNLKPDSQPAPLSNGSLYLSILTDERNDAAGLPLGAALVLSHIARFMPGRRSSGQNNADKALLGAEKEETKDEQLIESVFGAEVKERMFFALAHCVPARMHVGNILRNIRRSGG